MGDYYICHHGIKGMKWGVRRWQNADGSYNAAGKARYGFGDGKGYGGVKGTNGKTYSINKPHNSSSKSTTESNQASGKQKKGLTKAQKIALGIGIGAAAAGTAYALHKTGMDKKIAEKAVDTVENIKQNKRKFDTYVLGKNEVDTVIDKNVELSRIQTNKNFEGFAYYATYKNHDVNEYTGLYGTNLKNRAIKDATASGDKAAIEAAKNMDVYRLGLGNKKNLNVPSDHNAGKITAGLLKDKEFHNNVSQSLADARKASNMRRPGQQALLSSAQKIMKKDPSTWSEGERRKVYKALNLTLTFHDDNNLKVQDKFYGALKKHGYGAIVDVNDQQFSSYHAKRPMIVFDTGSTYVKSSEALDSKRVSQLNHKYNIERSLKEAVHQPITSLPYYLRTIGNDATSLYEDRISSGQNAVKSGVKKQSNKVTNAIFDNPDKAFNAARVINNVNKSAREEKKRKKRQTEGSSQ